ncbi:MAG: type II toxin-antitoxin system RelE/ParE family toxin [Bacteroidales bacterium]|nr:type II toxin-antitoxin system RelE/ParE family toxin [Bacteroidales bacterium]
MSYNIVPIPVFQKQAKRLMKKFPSLKKELVALGESLINDPTQGQALGNSCYKIRLAIESKGKGKSGGARVITHVHVAGEDIFLLTMYDKSEKDSISNSELIALLAYIK